MKSFSIFVLQALLLMPLKHAQMHDAWLLSYTCSFAHTLTVNVGGRIQKVFSAKVHAPEKVQRLGDLVAGMLHCRFSDFLQCSAICQVISPLSSSCLVYLDSQA